MNVVEADMPTLDDINNASPEDLTRTDTDTFGRRLALRIWKMLTLLAE